MKVSVSEKSRTLLSPARGERIPGAFVRELTSEAVTCGWLRGGGVLEDVELATFRPLDKRIGPPRRIAGRVHVISVEGSVGLTGSDVTVGLRAICSRETDTGFETFAGEITSARVVAFEAVVHAMDDVAVPRDADEETGAVLFVDPSAAAAPIGPRATPRSTPPEARVVVADRPEGVRPSASFGGPSRDDAPQEASAWSAAAAASVEVDQQQAYRPAPARSVVPTTGSSGSSVTGTAVPARIPAKARAAEEESVFPEAGDVVEHFAFGRGDVVRSDGDRLHIRAGKEGRVREIALEMLKCTLLEPEGDKRRFKLERKL